jgi:hypothetical protein
MCGSAGSEEAAVSFETPTLSTKIQHEHRGSMATIESIKPIANAGNLRSIASVNIADQARIHDLKEEISQVVLAEFGAECLDFFHGRGGNGKGT